MSGDSSGSMPTKAELESAEQSLRESLLQIYYLKAKLRAAQGAGLPDTGLELRRLEARAVELLGLWTSLRHERVIAATEQLLASSEASAETASQALDRLRYELEQRAAERKLRRELGGL